MTAESWGLADNMMYPGHDDTLVAWLLCRFGLDMWGQVERFASCVHVLVAFGLSSVKQHPYS